MEAGPIPVRPLRHCRHSPVEPLHPETGKPLTDLERALWRFRMVAHEAAVMWRGFNGVKDVERDINADLMFGITNQALVIVCKFLEVWDDSGSLAPAEPRIILARRAAQPIIDRIRRWKGLETFRNTTLAHAYLDKDDKLLPPWELFRRGLAPTYHAEIVLLLQCVVFGALAILAVFEKEYAPLDKLAGPGDMPLPPPSPGISLGTEIEGELKAITQQVDFALRRDFGITGDSPLFVTFKRSLLPRPAA